MFHKVIARVHGWMIEQVGHCDTYKMSKRSIVCLSGWLSGLLGNTLIWCDAGYWNHHKMQPPQHCRHWGRDPAGSMGNRNLLQGGEWPNSSTGLRKLTGRSVAGMENVWLCKPGGSFGHSSLCAHTQIFS